MLKVPDRGKMKEKGLILAHGSEEPDLYDRKGLAAGMPNRARSMAAAALSMTPAE